MPSSKVRDTIVCARATAIGDIASGSPRQTARTPFSGGTPKWSIAGQDSATQNAAVPRLQTPRMQDRLQFWCQAFGSETPRPRSEGDTEAPGEEVPLRSSRFCFLSAIVAAFLWAPAAHGQVPHTVEPGETLWSIAAASNLTTRALAAANGLSQDAQVVAGSTIQIPSEQEAAAALAGTGQVVASTGAQT